MTGPARGARAHDLPELGDGGEHPRPAPINAALRELRSLGLDGTADRIEELPASDRAAYCRMRADRMRRAVRLLEEIAALCTPDDGRQP